MQHRQIEADSGQHGQDGQFVDAHMQLTPICSYAHTMAKASKLHWR